MKVTFSAILMLSALYAQCAGADGGLKKFMAKAGKQRVAVVAFGDSNQVFGGHGWRKYMAEAIKKQFGSYGTGLVQVKDRMASWAKFQGSINKGAPDALAGKLFSYWYLPAGEKQKADWNITGFEVPAGQPFDITAKLKFRIRYATFTEGNGSFRPAVRFNRPPWKTFKRASAPVSTKGDSVAMKEYDMTIDADKTRTTKILFSVSQVGTMIKSPFLGEFMSVEGVDKANGCTYQTMYGVGGHSLLEMLNFVRKKGEDAVAGYFDFIRGSLNGDKSCAVIINSGLNDRNRKITSIGPEKKHMANTGPGYKDNLKGLAMFLEKCWIKAGGTKDTIHFIFIPSHPISTPDDVKLVAYRKAALELAKEMDNASAIMLPELVSQATMKSNGYYDKRGNAHLTRKGYTTLSEAVVKAMTK